MKSGNKITGNRGEDIASEYLVKKGYGIEERNFSTRFGEIDIVCWDGEILVFVEVKTKIGHDFGEPEEMVNKGKLAQIQRMGEVYIEMKKLQIQRGSSSQEYLQGRSSGRREVKWGGQCRVDVVGIVLVRNGNVESINHYEAVY